jgi:hypothetical protein
MTRASLLQILDHVTGISEAEVRELEQLAATFPYCQTAHLLLAKAAHDRGNMLASQRLRRAATYATDRELLRHLIEMPAPAVQSAVPSPAAEEPAVLRSADELEITQAQSITEDAPTPEVAYPQAAEALTDSANFPAEEQTATVAADAPAEPPVLSTLPTEEITPELTTAAPAVAEADLASLAAVEVVTNAEAAAEYADAADAPAAGLSEQDVVVQEDNAEEQLAPVTEANQPKQDLTEAALPTEAQTDATTSANLAEQADVQAPTADLLPAELEVQPEPEQVAEPVQEAATEAVPETTVVAAAIDEAASAVLNDELPPVAPPIRPPVEAGSSRFEFGLADAPAPMPVYQLPGLTDEPDSELEPASIPSFHADEHLGYALAAGSRFGYCLTQRDAELTHSLPIADDWYADALLLEYLAQHRPAAPPAPTSIALIDKFLRNQPRLRGAAPRPMINPEPQADLSVRSTSAAPSLASESLAKIMIRQGKTARAIEIYEQLMQRQPEKKAYFAAQIDLLNQQTE